MKITPSLFLPLLIAAQGFTLIINHKNGTTTEYEVEDVVDIRFEEKQQDDPNPPAPGQLSSPYVVVTVNNRSDVLVQWGYVSNAGSFEYSLDGAQPTRVTGNNASFQNISEGTHSVSVTAIPSSDEYIASEPTVKSFETGFRLLFSTKAATTSSVSVDITSNSANDYKVAIVPVSQAHDEASCLAYVNANPTETQSQTITAAASSEVTFTGLDAATSYFIVGYRDNLDYAYIHNISTLMDQQPGDTGSIFPNGVSATEGFVDVDKVLNTGKYGLDDSDDVMGADNCGDELMCWACAASGMCQWWLDEYKRVTGKDYELQYPLPSHGIYSTDIMEAFVRAYGNDAGDIYQAVKWFFAGVDHNWTLNDHKMLNENYPYWKGGFANMTNAEICSYMNVSAEASDGYAEHCYIYNRTYSNKGLTREQSKKKFSRIVIDTLREGPIGASVSVPGHAVSWWGCDYKIDADGDPIVTDIYVSENDYLDGNARNAIQKCSVKYDASDVRDIYYMIPSAYDGGSVQTTRINNFFGIKGYKATQIK